MVHMSFPIAKYRRGEHTGAMSCRRLFLTDNGYVGIALADARKDDEICFLFGGNVPMSHMLPARLKATTNLSWNATVWCYAW